MKIIKNSKIPQTYSVSSDIKDTGYLNNFVGLLSNYLECDCTASGDSWILSELDMIHISDIEEFMKNVIGDSNAEIKNVSYDTITVSPTKVNLTISITRISMI